MGGVYVRFFMKDPKTPLRRPKNFLEGLLELYVEELGMFLLLAQQFGGPLLQTLYRFRLVWLVEPA